MIPRVPSLWFAAALALAPVQGARAQNWEGMSEAGVLCRALLNETEGFFETNRNAIARYWVAPIAMSDGPDGGQRLRIGSEKSQYWVDIDEVSDGAVHRLSCAVNINPAYLGDADIVTLGDWYLSWQSSQIGSGDFEPAGVVGDGGLKAAMRAVAPTGRGCRLLLTVNVDPAGGAIWSRAEETAAAGCGGAPVVPALYEGFSR